MRIYVIMTVNIEISCHTIIDLKECVARPASSFSSVLLKSDLHFAAKVRKRFCFRRQKTTERERKERWRMRSFVHSLCFVLSFSGRWRWLVVPFRATTKLREKSTEISTAYEKFMAQSRAISSLLMYIQKLHHQWKSTEKPQRFTKYAAPYLARVNKLQSIGREMSQSLSCSDKNI